MNIGIKKTNEKSITQPDFYLLINAFIFQEDVHI